MKPIINNIFDDIAGSSTTDEIVDQLFENKQVRIERIVSRGPVSPDENWYDQSNDEWVMVLKGRATLSFDVEGATVDMKAGDYIFIPAHQRHRVDWIDPEQDTIWLAVHIMSEARHQ